MPTSSNAKTGRCVARSRLGVALAVLAVAGAASAVTGIYHTAVLLNAAPAEHIRGRVQGPP